MRKNRIAVISDELGELDNYQLRDCHLNGPKPGEIQIAVQASGVSFVDVLNAKGLYQNKAPTPFVPGSECSGTVSAIGPGCSENFELGQRVMATCWGGAFSSLVNIPEKNVHALPNSLDFIEGSVFSVSIATAWHALVDRGSISNRDTVLVLGAGGATGYAAVQVAKYFGCKVIASASTSDKLNIAMQAGADILVQTTDHFVDNVRECNSGAPVDIVFDPVGGQLTQSAFRCLGWAGRHLVVGFPAGITFVQTNYPLLKGASLIGVNLQQFNQHCPELATKNLRKLTGMAELGVFRPCIGAVYPLEEFKEAMTLAEQGRIAGRIVLSV